MLPSPIVSAYDSSVFSLFEFLLLISSAHAEFFNGCLLILTFSSEGCDVTLTRFSDDLCRMPPPDTAAQNQRTVLLLFCVDLKLNF